MINQFESIVKTTIAYLKLLDVKVNDSTVNEFLQNHPDWPSLLCISDSLTKWNIPNAAGKIEQKEINQLPTPFLATMASPDNPITIVTKTDEENVYFISNLKSLKETYQKKEEFFRNWIGVYLISEATSESLEKDYNGNRRKQIVSSLIPYSFFLASVSFAFVYLYGNLNKYLIEGGTVASAFYQFCLYLTGIIISTLLLWYEIDRNNPALKKVCTGMSKGSCEAVLNAKQSKLFSWLSWSEIGLFFFFGGAINIMLAGSFISVTLQFISYLNLLAAPYILFSIFYQSRIIKQWCVLCLAIQGVIFLGAINSSLEIHEFQKKSIVSAHTLQFVLLYILPLLGWFAIKPTILKIQSSKTIKREYLRIKFNNEIFNTLLHRQKKIIHSYEGLGIQLGNLNASNVLLKVCNPYCGPCAQSHPELEALLENTPNLKAQILFVATNKQDDRNTPPVKHFLAIDEIGNKTVTKEALDEWYSANEKNYISFANKFPMNAELKQQGHKIEQMYEWCKKMDIQVTPTFFLNGHQLPEAYKLKDLQYFLYD